MQHCSVLHVNSLSAGATPFSTDSKLLPSDSPKPSNHKGRKCPAKAAIVPEEVQKTLIIVPLT